MPSTEFLASVSATLVYGTSVKGSLYSYYYSKSFPYNTYPPTGILAILKNSGVQVAELKGKIVNPVWNNTCYSVCINFLDLSFNSYTFTCICIYTCYSKTLNILVAKFSGLNYTKKSDCILNITYKLGVAPYAVACNIFWIAFSFAWIICGVNNVFKVSQYTGISKFVLCNLNGSVELVAVAICPTSVVFYANIYTNGSVPNSNQGSYITAVTNTPPQSTVFKIPITYKLPATSSNYYVPVKFGVVYV